MSSRRYGARGAPYGSGARSEVNRRTSCVGAVGDTLSYAREHQAAQKHRGHRPPSFLQASEAWEAAGRAQIRCHGARGLAGPATPYGVGARFGVGCAVRTNSPCIRTRP